MTKIAVDTTYPVSIQTERVDRLDEYGQAIGYSLISTSDWGSWVDHYDLSDRLVGGRYEDGQGFTSEWSQQLDALGNVIESRFESSDGSWEAANRVEAPDVPFGPVGLSHALSTTGFWPGSGSYSRLDVFDLNGIRVHSRASYADGSSEFYEIQPVRAEDGSISAYTGLWTWTGADGLTSSWSEALDLNLLPVWNMSDDPSIMPLAKGMATSRDAVFGGRPEQKPLMSDRDSLNLNSPEHQLLTHGILTGRRDLRLRGNALDNVLVGNDGDNRINGGPGSDVISGGKGKDSFILRPRFDEPDTITDFDPSRDRIVLKGKGFGILFDNGELGDGVLGGRLRFDASTETLMFSSEADTLNSFSRPIVSMPGVKWNQIQENLFLAS